MSNRPHGRPKAASCFGGGAEAIPTADRSEAPVDSYGTSRSWVDLLPVCENSGWITLHFRAYRNYFCLPPISLVLARIPIPGTFHPRKWSLPLALPSPR